MLQNSQIVSTSKLRSLDDKYLKLLPSENASSVFKIMNHSNQQYQLIHSSGVVNLNPDLVAGYTLILN